MEISESAQRRKIIHVDMDAFYASVEQRDNPALRNQPVIVGGKPDGRGVVAACSYEARQFGIHSAMPSAEAGRRCPQAHFLKPRFSVYKEVSIQIHSVFREFSRLVEPLSLDEAYLDVTDSTLFKGSAMLLAKEVKALILQRTALVASAGVSYNKFLAKIASDYDKPDGLFCIRPEEGEAFVADLPVGRFYGVGKVTEARMQELGIFKGSDLRAWTMEELQREFGKSAGYYYRAARGIDERPVRSSRTRKSMGSERTFAENLTQREQMLDVLNSLASQVLESLREKQLEGATINIKVRFGDFATFTRSYTHPGSALNILIATRVLPFLLDRVLILRSEAASHREPGIRLLGVSLSTLTPIDNELPEQLEIDL